MHRYQHTMTDNATPAKSLPQIEMDGVGNHGLHSQIALTALLETALETLSLEKQLDVALEIILSVSWLTMENKGSIFLVEEETGELVMIAHRNLPPPILKKCARIKPGNCMCGRVALEHALLFSNHLDDRHDILFEDMQPHGHYCVPIISHSHLLGVLNLYIPHGHQYYSEEDAFLSTAANHLANLIQRRLWEQQSHKKNAYTQSIIDQCPGAIFSVSQQQTLVEFNRSSETSLGYKKSELEGKSLALIFSDPTQLQQLHTTTLNQGNFLGTVTLKKKNGDLFQSLIASSLLDNTSGTTSDYVCTLYSNLP